MLYTYYGDDFTGSTDVLEQLGANGVPAVLFLGPPSEAHLAAFPNVQAIGIAGDARSRSPEWMTANLPSVFRILQKFNAPITHYKVCSTFDSSPTTGSIGRAIGIGREVFAPAFAPVVVGAPHLRRFVAFGNLFAAAPDGSIQRIDRHPMSHHPVTPMQEADLRLHLGPQGCRNVGLLDLRALQCGSASATLDTLIASGHSTVVFDTIDCATQAAVGELLWARAQQRPIFAAGSSGLTAALIPAWRANGLCGEPLSSAPVPRIGPLLVISGSCSTVTERQLRYATSHGYRGIPLDPDDLLDPFRPTRAEALAAASLALAAGRDTILYTSLGATDAPARGDALGVGLGNLLLQLLLQARSFSAPIRRVLICGGDTSSHAVQQLGIHALTWLANIQPGGPLCRAHSDGPLDGLELVLKGGQVGTPDFFDHVRGT
jgi:uncharacterized protein YgbK (DUF1537 family)